jgi:hypothetical protein
MRLQTRQRIVPSAGDDLEMAGSIAADMQLTGCSSARFSERRPEVVTRTSIFCQSRNREHDLHDSPRSAHANSDCQTWPATPPNDLTIPPPGKP